MQDQAPLREVLVAAATAGHLLQAIYATSVAEQEERDDLARALAALHKEGALDVVEAFHGLKRDAGSGLDFFLTRHVFEKTLPHLDAPVDRVIQCVLQLWQQAGEDLAAGTILEGYIGFCARDPARPRAALALIEADPAGLIDILPATISAGSQVDHAYYVTELVRLCRHPDIDLRRRSVFSLARVRWPAGTGVPEAAFATLEQAVAAESDDHLLAAAIQSAFAFLQQDGALQERSVALISTALAKGDAYALHAASELLWRNTRELPDKLRQVLLVQLKRVKPEHVGTVNNIDLAITQLLKRDDPEDGLRLLEHLLTAHSAALTAKRFDSVMHAIRNNPALMSKVLTRWFLRGEQALCKAICAAGRAHAGSDLRIEIDASELMPADHPHILFVARKAVGYFFMKPVTAASVVISLMRHAPDDQTLNALGELLLDPLLLNYTGSTRDYVADQAQREADRVKEAIDRALVALAQYLEALCAVPTLVALHPALAHREAYRRHMADTMGEAMRAAEKKSVLASLFTRSTLLYGNKSISYIAADVGGPRRMEVPLGSHGVSIEVPRMDHLDPYGLDYMVRVFRLEQRRA